MKIELPISKSIANRILILQAMHGDPLMEVSAAMPDDVRLLHDVLESYIDGLKLHTGSDPVCSYEGTTNVPVCSFTFDLQNCGTAMRFLTAYFAQLPGCDVVLTGCERMRERPIGQLVDALRTRGARIIYKEREGYPPLHIIGQNLGNHGASSISSISSISSLSSISGISGHAGNAGNPIILNDPQSTQYISALLLTGFEVETNSTSPYIAMTRRVIENYTGGLTPCVVFGQSPNSIGVEIERDWSAAAFWLERWALGLCPMPEFPGLNMDSIQGDRVALDIFTRLRERPSSIALDFSDCPDLYPAVAITCRQLGIQLIATGTESLRIKESDRIAAVETLSTEHDHRMAMALLAADLPCDDTDCISKSYPDFLRQLRAMQGVERLSDLVTRITPRRGINDEGRGKKYALRKLIQKADTPYVWLTDDDIKAPLLSPPEGKSSPSLYSQERIAALNTLAQANLSLPQGGVGGGFEADLWILPLTMSAGTGNLLCRLQQAEYAAIQQLTIETARRGHAVMCSGANLLVLRDKWLAAYEDIHPEIPSGDDMFILESFKRRGWRVATIDAAQETLVRVSIDPRTTVESFLRQRTRWAGKAPSFTDRDILACGVIILIANLLQLLCPLVILIKFPIEYHLIKNRDTSVSFWIALLLEVVYPFYMLYCLLIGMQKNADY